MMIDHVVPRLLKVMVVEKLFAGRPRFIGRAVAGADGAAARVLNSLQDPDLSGIAECSQRRKL